jgi:site-specific DNA recombinase
MSEEAVRAAIYCRMSLAVMGDTTKVEDQERLCREVCDRRGWTVAGVYTDNNRSAWQKNRKRPAWNQMLEDVGAGKIGAIVVYHGDRLVRQPWDLELLLKLSDGKGIRLASPTGTRNLDNDDDQFILSIEAAAARRESAATSRRKKQQYERWRREGKVRAGGRGGRPFGFQTDCVTWVPPEVALIRRMATMLLSGESVGEIARAVNDTGTLTPAGNPFSHGTLRKMLARPRYAGLMPDGVSPAAWPAILEREEWEAVRAVLDTKAAAFGYATNARRYLLSGIAACGVCGSGLQVRSEGRAKAHLTGYGCVKPGCRKVQRQVRLLDAYVTQRVINRLANPANPPGAIPAAPGLAAQFAALAAQRAETEAAIADPGQGSRLTLLLGRLDAIELRLTELRELAAGDARGRLVSGHAGISAEQFAELPLAVRRSLVAACFHVRVLPASRRGPGFESRDVRLTAR